MSYTSYFGIEGKFMLPKDFFVGDLTKIEENKSKITDFKALGDDMTLRQNKEMQELEKELIYILNPYGFKILLTHESHRYNDYALYLNNYRDFSDHMLIYNIDKKKATIAFANDDRQTINFILLGNKFSPVEMPYSISDRGEEQWLIENIIQKCKMTITILDKGDEEHGYEEDGCDRKLKHTVYIDGVIQNRRA